jgi:hypothetical protein
MHVYTSPLLGNDDAQFELASRRVQALLDAKRKHEVKARRSFISATPVSGAPQAHVAPNDPRTASAIKIQSLVRRYLAQHAVRLVKERQQWKIANTAAIGMQRLTRGFLSRVKTTRFRALLLSTAACLIQRRYRILRAKRLLKFLQTFHHKVRVWRRYLVMACVLSVEWCLQTRREAAVVTIQKHVRASQARRKYGRFRIVVVACCVAIQRLYRGHAVRKSGATRPAVNESET